MLALTGVLIPLSLLLLRLLTFVVSITGFVVSSSRAGEKDLDPGAALPTNLYSEPDCVTTMAFSAAISGFCKRVVVMTVPSSHAPRTVPDDKTFQS